MAPLVESSFSSDLTQLHLFSLSSPVDTLLSTSTWSAWSSPSSLTRSTSAVSSSRLSVSPAKPITRTRMANLYLYRTTTARLVLAESKKVSITLEEEPFASGGVCEAFRIWMMKADGSRGPLQVAKQYKFKDGKQGFREDHVSWFMANGPVNAFNAQMKKVEPKSPTVSFVPCVKLLELDGHWYSVEDFLAGTWTKYNNIFGTAESLPLPGEGSTYQDLAAAFSHFSFEHSGHEYLVLDVQGVEGRYTDPAIVSRTASKYGYTDTGLQGMQGFFSNHTCNRLCHKLGLKPVSSLHLPPVKPPLSTGVKPKPANSLPSTPRSTATTTSTAAAAETKKPKPLAAINGTKSDRKQAMPNNCRQASMETFATNILSTGLSLPWESQPPLWTIPALTTYSIV